MNTAPINTLIENETGEIWFVGKEVAEMLGYTNPRKAIDDHCKTPKIFKGNDSLLLQDLVKSPRGLTFIPERDVYRLVIHSRLPHAEQFEEWVVGTVLPSIRQHGAI